MSTKSYKYSRYKNKISTHLVAIIPACAHELLRPSKFCLSNYYYGAVNIVLVVVVIIKSPSLPFVAMVIAS